MEFVDAAALDESCGECGDDCGPEVPCNVFALLSHECGGEWLNG